ncbi:Transcriptional regulator, contains XRE-family HTH domain [Saccharopolyspora antimicrobica]|uniref:Transcriptional regulator with XRE-family HTH domain n=1 Tax=Saccharopolyspora antimicrobica TaxID=455193 RepID=A0A1I5ABM2_9PSEU|nr:helix-turn-helix domain-containing protein [Saccharopolyspora antimicrobica]RKT83201.1 transcriptional regulator with XRE-family HTH domain [Saccharopolyspora antimicrobica]SFN59806.1 Transcriptional regulator, contains XRE-family HTH domain [Saccharopolyspora antimicrobica]
MAEVIGKRLREIRRARGKSLTVIAGLAGISASYLSRLESGERALDRRSLVVDLANALEVAPSELTDVPLAVPRERSDDHALAQVRLALLATSLGEPRGEAQSFEQLRARVRHVLGALNGADNTQAGAALPGLIRDLHTTANTRHDEPGVLRLLALTHMQGTQAWLVTIGAPMDLSWQAATLARQAAEQLDEPVSLGVSAYGTALGLLSAGAFDLAAQTLSDVELPLVTTEEVQLAGSLALASSLVSAAQKDQAERAAALDHAAELAERTGETNLLGFGFGPSNVAVWRMQCALEAGDHAEAAAIAESVDPEALTVRARQAVYWREYGRALARLPKQRDTAVMVLRRAEQISPEHVHRHPFTCSTLSELVARAKRDAVGRELRGMAYRAGLHV